MLIVEVVAILGAVNGMLKFVAGLGTSPVRDG